MWQHKFDCIVEESLIVVFGKKNILLIVSLVENVVKMIWLKLHNMLVGQRIIRLIHARQIHWSDGDRQTSESAVRRKPSDRVRKYKEMEDEPTLIPHRLAAFQHALYSFQRFLFST